MQELEIELNNNNICLPSPIVKTSMVELLYMQYPAAISFCPICIGFRSEHSEASLLHSLPSRLRTRGSIPSKMLEWVHSIRRNSHALEQTVERKTCMWYPYPKIVPVVIDASMELLTSKGWMMASYLELNALSTNMGRGSLVVKVITLPPKCKNVIQMGAGE